MRGLLNVTVLRAWRKRWQTFTEDHRSSSTDNKACWLPALICGYHVHVQEARLVIVQPRGCLRSWRAIQLALFDAPTLPMLETSDLNAFFSLYDETIADAMEYAMSYRRSHDTYTASGMAQFPRYRQQIHRHFLSASAYSLEALTRM
jgi:hypothetical protein